MYKRQEVVSTTCNLVSEIEHHLMSVRTKEALNHKKEKEGLQLGRPKGTDAKQSLLDANKDEVMNMLERGDTVVTVSYTHLDVYKRQILSLFNFISR